MNKINNNNNIESRENLTFKQAIIPVITMAFFILMSVTFWKVPIQLALFFEISFTILLALIWGYRWKEIEAMLFSSFESIGNVILILFLIGMMIGVWIGIGTVPTMIYYGLKAINPRYFFVLSFIITSAVSMAVGTAIGTASTIGLALISIAESLGLNMSIAAGSIISGCYVGDRMSPVSSIANITANSAGAKLTGMIKKMIYTIIPPYILSLIIYFLIGYFGNYDNLAVDFTKMTSILQGHFNISIFMLLPPLLIIVLAIMQLPTILNLIINIFASLVLGIFFTGRTYTELLNIMFSGFSDMTGVEFIDNILSRGGLTSMLELVSLIIFAVILGGIFENLGILNSLLNRLIKNLNSKFHLIAVTMASSAISAILGCNQFLAVFLPARMMIKQYDKANISREILGRSLGDSGLILSPLIPWNVNALMMTAVLGVSTIKYFRFSFLPLLLPLSSLAFAFFTNKKIK
ncbi:MAG TPA: Na+/H+ antiporter NhaC family protein [Halanaerobiales bacterium]|nr:Na+/H+ antiporter NhaC family protein [Halanaerobiales bacterium]